MGLQKAGALFKEPFNSHRQTNNLGITHQLEEATYKLQILRMRVGHAWELIFTDYWFT